MSESESESENEYFYCKCDDINEVLNWIRLVIDEFIKTEEETRYYLHIPTSVIGNLFDFKRSIPDLLDVYEKFFIDDESDQTAILEHCRYREKYIGDKKFHLMLFFSYIDEDNENLEIQTVAYWSQDDSDDDSDKFSDYVSEEKTDEHISEHSDDAMDDD